MRDADRTRDRSLHGASDPWQKVTEFDKADRSFDSTAPCNPNREIHAPIGKKEADGPKGMEEALQASEALLDAIIEHSPHAMWVSDQKGILIRMNQACRDLFRVTDDDLVGKYNVFEDNIVEEQGAMPLVKRAFEWGEKVHFSLNYDSSRLRSLELKETGRVVLEVTLSPVMDTRKKVVRVIVQHQDITERKKLEHAVKQAEAKYRAIFDNASIGIYQTTVQGRVVSANPALARMFGCDSPQELIDFVTDIPTQVYADPLEFTKVRELCLKQGFVDGYEALFRRKDGSTGWVSINMSPIKDAEDNVVYFEGTVKDIDKRKHAEDALRASEAKYRELVEHSNSIILRMDTVGRITFFNEFAQSFFGYDEQEILGRNVVGTIVPEYESTGRDLKSVIEEIGRNPDSYVNNVNENMRHNGDRVWVAWANKPVYDDRGRVIEILCIGNDITKQKKAEELLEERDQILRAVIHGSPIPQFVIGKDHRVLYWNEVLTKYTGISAEEMVGTRGHWKALYGEKRPCLADFLVDGNFSGLPRWYSGKFSASELVEGAYEAIDHFPLLGKEPRWLHFTAAPIRDSEGSIIGAVETLVDITERKEAEDALKKSEEKYRGIIENAVEGIFQSTTDGRFLSVNPAMATMCGYSSPEEMITRISDLAKQHYLSPKDRPDFMRRVEMEGFVKGFEHQIRRKDGSTRWASVSARAVRDRDGSILCYEGTVLDITERMSLEAQLLQSQKMEAIGTLAGGVAHDFNNILMAIMGYAGLIGMKVQEDPELSNYLKQMQDCTSRAANVTRSLLAFSRKQVIELIPNSTNTILRDCEKLLRRLVPEDVILTLSLSEDVVIMADMTQIDQVLINLVSNAKDAMPKGGRLHIEAKAVDLDGDFKLSHGFGEPGRYALISVADTGKGMDEATQKKIFEPFFTTKEMGKGTGLGLSIVYGIIKQHGGYITVSSEPEKGTTFDIYLPAVKAQVSETQQTSAQAPGGTETILLAEDDDSVREIAGEILRTSGYTVVEAKDGEDAVRKYGAHRENISLLVLDVVMPGKNGRDVYDEIRKMGSPISVIFMSGYTGDVVLDKGVQDTAVDYIPKPLSASDLLRKVRTALDR